MIVARMLAAPQQAQENVEIKIAWYIKQLKLQLLSHTWFPNNNAANHKYNTYNTIHKTFESALY